MKILVPRGPELLEISRRSIEGFSKHDMPTYAAALAYRMLFALFPLLAFLVALLGFLGINSFFEWLIEQSYSALQGQYAGLGERLVIQVQYQAQGGGLLSSVVAIALWSVSSGVRSLTKALNAAYGVEESRPAWKRVLIQLFFALGLPITIILASALLLIGPRVVEWLVGLVGLDEAFIYLWTWLHLPVALILLTFAVSLVYWAVPNVNHRFRLTTPGAALSVIVWIVASLGFSFYMVNFADYSVVYGSLGAAVALLLYFYISAAVLLLGAEVNAAIHDRASYRKVRKEGHGTGPVRQ
jgi:membrane protein